MVRAYPRWLLAALGLATVLAGCSPGPMIDRLPDNMGLPAGAPARPATPYQYPAVHDMPPARSTPPMSGEEQARLEKELAAVRERQEGRDGPAKKPAQPAKKKPAGGDSGQATPDAKNAGTNSNP
jgi:hypothetical protein